MSPLNILIATVTAQATLAVTGTTIITKSVKLKVIKVLVDPTVVILSVAFRSAKPYSEWKVLDFF